MVDFGWRKKQETRSQETGDRKYKGEILRPCGSQNDIPHLAPRIRRLAEISPFTGVR